MYNVIDIFQIRSEILNVSLIKYAESTFLDGDRDGEGIFSATFCRDYVLRADFRSFRNIASVLR